MTTEPEISGADVAAAELALGVLDGEERAAALRRMLAEPDFARDVERWRDHFAVMFAGSPRWGAPQACSRRSRGELGVRPARVNPGSNAIAASLARWQ